MHAVIYHNPGCGTSHNTLALMRHTGVEPQIVDYLQHPPSRQAAKPPSRQTLQSLIAAAGITVREAIRQKGTPYLELGLDDPALDDAALLSAMLAHPILINRPFVQTARGTRLCRPSELVLDLLPPATHGFIKEDGERVLDEAGQPIGR
ncbi:arsenate reductase (glutaredoxin) [Xanthomonas axonopodis]|uniref:arsenate reductase (glutaredoxin) n=1 Tax=Xanthomonas axonopodis TaxID=53413 RepID=UPI000D44BAA2|nr:arsenate reductase (glutaredoxin) [Xanthomonas axonopodis]PPV10743.1 arsenate reductase (glutaredoxin) [Xanthomonas axonopodis pv. vasculorum]QKD88446.1 arsenate reductase (glutaredoxin) [Xanthomonas axonopodis pv. vasculorum]